MKLDAHAFNGISGLENCVKVSIKRKSCVSECLVCLPCEWVAGQSGGIPGAQLTNNWNAVDKPWSSETKREGKGRAPNKLRDAARCAPLRITKGCELEGWRSEGEARRGEAPRRRRATSLAHAHPPDRYLPRGWVSPQLEYRKYGCARLFFQHSWWTKRLYYYWHSEDNKKTIAIIELNSSMDGSIEELPGQWHFPHTNYPRKQNTQYWHHPQIIIRFASFLNSYQRKKSNLYSDWSQQSCFLLVWRSVDEAS